MRKSLATTAATAAVGLGLVAGSIGVAAVAGPFVAGAQEGGSATTEQAGHPRLRHAVLSAVRTTADTIGIEPRALLEELRAGKTIAQVATDNGVDPQVVVDELIAKGNARIDEALANGRISAEEADRAKAKLAEKVPELVNRTWPRLMAWTPPAG
ncbi:MAG: hypothetical protein MUF83_07920 [Acidimicrobiales bacterium]|jgi:hypothetical protein|nr:hypothetical protein [Acidimicrobiales bacterium]